MTDSSILTPNNHELHKLVRARIEAQYPLSFIAQELGVETKDLIDWLMDVYKAPRRDKPLVNAKYGPAIGVDRSPSANARHFAAWKKQHDGAAATRRMHEVANR